MTAVTLAAVVALFVSLVAEPSATAQAPSDRDSVAAAGQPHAYTISGNGWVNHRDYLWSEHGRSRAGYLARHVVHNSRVTSWCVSAFCTIQIFNGDRYRVYRFDATGCTLWGLDNFGGLWDAANHNGTSMIFLNQDGSVHANYWSGRDTPVNWGPIWRIRHCP